MRKILVLLLLVPFSSSFPQVIENLGVLALGDFPHAEIRHFAFGNYGFDEGQMPTIHIIIKIQEIFI